MPDARSGKGTGEMGPIRSDQTSILMPFCTIIGLLTFGIMYTNIITQPKEVAMQVGDILRKRTSARGVTMRMNETVGVAAQLMRANNISALVVKDVVRSEGNTAVGMFTERDVVRAIAEHGAAGLHGKGSPV